MSQMDWIRERLREFGDADFLIFKRQRYSYADLLENVDHWTTVIGDQGIRPGDSIAMIGDYSPNTIFLFLALVLNQNIAIPLSLETEEKKDRFFRIAQVNGFFRFDEQDRWTYERLESHGEPAHPFLDSLRRANEAGIVIFSSGTTGESKGSLLQAGKLFEKFRNAKRKPFRTLIFLKLDHIGGVNTLFSIMFNGGALVTISDRSPKAVCRAIEEHRVQLLPTTPTFLNMVIISNIFRDFDLSSLQAVTYGTEPMPASTLKAANQVFPHVKLKQTYGLTELGIFSTQSKDNHSNWMKIGGHGVETKVVNGTLWVRTRSAMVGYLNAPSPFDEQGWYNTGDQVEIDGPYYRILGRKQDIINVGGEKVYPAEVESVLLEVPNIREAVVKGKKSPITGQIVTAVVVLEEPEDVRSLRKRILAYCNNRVERFKVPTVIRISEESLVSDRFKTKRAIET